MTQPIFNYDEVSDTLYISFVPGEQATGIELTPHILLRLNKQERKAIGMTFLEYSLLAQKTEMGPRSFPLTGLSELSDDLKDIVSERHCYRCSPTSPGQRRAFAFILHTINFRNDSDYASANCLLTDMSQHASKFISRPNETIYLFYRIL